jgi:hypothetical protein
MEIVMERKIGKEFIADKKEDVSNNEKVINKVKLKVKLNDTCNGCYYSDGFCFAVSNNRLRDAGVCRADSRSDKKAVIFEFIKILN